MISLSRLQEKAGRKYWQVLKSYLRGESIFPLIIPAGRSIPADYSELRRVVGELVENAKTGKGKGYRLEFEERITRKHGRQSIPTRIIFDSGDDFLTFIRKKREAEKVLDTAQTLCAAFPELKPWVERSPQKIAGRSATAPSNATKRYSSQKTTSHETGVSTNNSLEGSATAPSNVTKRYPSQKTTSHETGVSTNNSLEGSATAPSNVTKRYSSQKTTSHETGVSTNNSLEGSATAPSNATKRYPSQKTTSHETGVSTNNSLEGSATAPSNATKQDSSQKTTSHENEFFSNKSMDEWQGIIEVLTYFRHNPRPGKYVRELPIKVHTKFIERHKGILGELLQYVIPGHIDEDGGTFEERFHLKTPLPLIRLRRLDPAVDETIFALSDDLALPVDVFNRLAPCCRNIVIVENQMTFLTLPPLQDTIAIYGGGFKVEILKEAEWLRDKRIMYWGDIDVHGFLILSLVRGHFPGVISIMMDEETFNRFREHCVPGTPAKEKDEKELNLTPDEMKMYRLVRDGNHRLEQEHLSQDYVTACFVRLLF